ncbi:MAG: methyltransferase, partial [Candidatus Puniceispirillaceae bacterium]
MMIDPARTILPDLPDGVEVTHDHLLDQQVHITQPKTGYRVGSDAVLAAASLTAGRGRVLDLGAGVGGISLCIARRLSGVHVTAVEIDPVAAALARYNVAVNGLDQ